MHLYKQFNIGLVIIPFIVLHCFGSHPILSKYNFSDLYEKPALSSFYSSSSALDLDCDVLCQEQIFKIDVTNIITCANRVNGVNRVKKSFVDGISMYDNRIDKIDQKFTQYLCLNGQGSQEQSLVIVV